MNKQINKPLVLLAIIATLATLYLFTTINKNKSARVIQEQPDTEQVKFSYYNFADVGISFSAPSGLSVLGESIDNETFIFTVANSKDGDDYYQLYGLYKLQNSDSASLDEFRDSLIPETIIDTNVGDYPAIDGQLAGERNRFMVYTITPKGVLTLATSQPTEENKILTENIIRTMSLSAD